MSTLIGLLPLIITTLWGLGTMSFVIKNAKQAEIACEKVAVSAQKKNLIHLKKILSLNPQATSLRQARALAKSQLAAALASGHPLAIVAAKAKLKAVTQAQTLLRAKQQAILTNSQWVTKSSTPTFLNQARGAGVTQAQLTERPRTGLALRATPKTSLTPNHEVPNDFARHQKISLSWKQDLFFGAPSWLTQWFGKHAYRRKTCSATLNQKEGLRWDVSLSEAK